jgi:hypothetical protein
MPSPDAPERGPAESRPLREITFLAREIASQSPVPALPGNQWGWHYPQGGTTRQERLQGLLQGRYQPDQVWEDLRPDALVYDVSDIQAHGLDAVTARLRDQALMARDYDYQRFARFVASLKGKDIDLDTVQALYDGVAGNRIRQQSIERALGGGGRAIIERLRGESERIARQFADSRGLQRVLLALQLDWSQAAGYSKPAEAQHVLDQLSPKERSLFDGLREIHHNYVQTGGADEYEQLAGAISDLLPQVEQVQDQMSPSMEKLQEALEQFHDQVPQPGDSGGPTFPSDAQDLHNQMDQLRQGESVEGVPAKPFYTIEAAGTSRFPMTGRYVEQRKSRFVPEALTWSNDTQLDNQEYSATIAGTERQRVSGTINNGIKNLGVPTTYALDMDSLQYSGDRPRFFRDQTGCFYIVSNGTCTFSVEFLKEPQPRFLPPTDEDIKPLPGGQLSTKTDAMLASLGGDARSNAAQIQRYLLSNHWYPGGGDHQAANALKVKVKSQSTAQNYVRNIDASEYLDCDLADTLGVHLLRLAGVPARLAVGHMIDQVDKDGKAHMNAGTGHAWIEFWDGRQWVPADFTPHAKPEDKKQNGEGESGGQGQQADDGLMERPPEPDQDLADQMQQRVDQQLQSMRQPPPVSDADMQQARQDLQQAQQDLQRMEQMQQSMQQQVNEAESFQSLRELEEQLKQSDMLDDMKQDLQQRIDDEREKKRAELQKDMQKMENEGFLDSERRQELEDQLQQEDARALDQLRKELKRESALYNEYDQIRQEVMLLVEHWYRYFVWRLPKEKEPQQDDETLGRSGSLDKRAVQRQRNVLLGRVKHPRTFKETPRPRFIGSILVDISGSMKTSGKDKLALRLLVFYAELFSRLEQEFGYCRFSINVFADTVREVKTFDQDYLSFRRYQYQDGDETETTTVRARLMKAVRASGGTNMLDALKCMSEGLNKQKRKYKNHASAFYLVGDGGDTCGNKENIKAFMRGSTEQGFFGKHLCSAIMLGSEEQRLELAELFGDEHTAVAGTLDEVIAKSMQQYDRDITHYCKRMNMLAA